MGRRRGISGVCGWSKRKASVARHKMPLCHSYRRELRFEPLEERRLLSITVNTLIDETDGSITDGDISLRDALAVAPAGETIDFSVTGAINLTGLGQLVIDKSLTIIGPGADLLAIYAFDPTPTQDNGDGSRVIRIDDGGGTTLANVEIRGLTIRGGDTNGSGGGIYTLENLTLANCVVTENTSTIATSGSGGGGIYNPGGFAVAGSLTILDSTISNNRASGDMGEGGGIRKRFGTLRIERSIISNNSARNGGGISAEGQSSTIVQISDGTISGNTARGSGGGLWIFNVTATVSNSTISGNESGSGGGIRSEGSNLTLRHSTISGNRSNNQLGGGLTAQNTFSLQQSIVAGNFRGDVPDDIYGSVNARFSLIGVNLWAGVIDSGGNLIGTFNAPLDPLLGPLADHGGPTWTHALLVGSPALDAGDPAAVAGVNGVPLYDQRGNPFGRVFDGDGVGGARIDIGAYESQPIPSAAIGDYNADGMTDTADYVLWRKTVGTTVTPFTGADGDGDGVIGQGDYGVWRGHFGTGGVGLGAAESSSVEGRESSAGALMQDSSLNSYAMAVGAQGAMPVSERLAYVAASLRDADGGVQAGVAAIAFVEWSDAARGALVGPVAPYGRVVLWSGEQVVFGRSTAGQASSGTQRNAATADAALVAWLSSRGREWNWGEEDSASGVWVEDWTESSLVPEDSDAVFAGLERTFP